MFLVILMFFVGVAMVMGLYFGAIRVPGMVAQRKLDARLQELSSPADDPKEGESLLVKVQHEGPMPAVDRFFAGTTRGSALGQWIEQSGLRASVRGVLMISLVCAGLMALVAGIITRASWGLPIGAALGFALPFLFLKIKRTRRMRAFEEQFPEALDLIARALKAGHAFATGLKMAADELPEPVGPEFRKTFDEQNAGLPKTDALDTLAKRIPILDVRFFVTAVLIQRETGGNLAEILENLGFVVRERFKILRQVRVHTAHGRFTGYVLLALPASLAVALTFINPEHMNLLFTERMGQTMILVAIVMQFAGFLWIKKIIKIEV